MGGQELSSSPFVQNAVYFPPSQGEVDEFGRNIDQCFFTFRDNLDIKSHLDIFKIGTDRPDQNLEGEGKQFSKKKTSNQKVGLPRERRNRNNKTRKGIFRQK